MKKIRNILVIILLVFISTGCTATYNVDIGMDEISDELVLKNLNLSENQIEIYKTNPIPVDINIGCFLDYDGEIKKGSFKKEDGIEYYDITSSDKNLNIKSLMSKGKYNNSRVVNSFFNNINVNNYDDMFSIYGYNGIVAFELYPDLDSVTVNITSKLDVVKNNADSISNNTYTWNFTRDNNENKTLYIEVNPNKKNKTNTKLTFAQFLLLIFSISFVILIPIIFILLKKRKYN